MDLVGKKIALPDLEGSVNMKYKTMFKNLCITNGYYWPDIFDNPKTVFFYMYELPRLEYGNDNERQAFINHRHKEISITDLFSELKSEDKATTTEMSLEIHNCINEATRIYRKGTVFRAVEGYSNKQIVSSGAFEIETLPLGCYRIIDSESQWGVYDSEKDKWAEVIRPPFEKKEITTGGDLIDEINYHPICHESNETPIAGNFVDIQESTGLHGINYSNKRNTYKFTGGKTDKGLFICEKMWTGGELIATHAIRKRNTEKDNLFNDKIREIFNRNVNSNNGEIYQCEVEDAIKDAIDVRVGEPAGYLFNGKFYKDIKELRGMTMDETNKPIPLYT